jgi:hypothetical protein
VLKLTDGCLQCSRTILCHDLGCLHDANISGTIRNLFLTMPCNAVIDTRTYYTETPILTRMEYLMDLWKQSSMRALGRKKCQPGGCQNN